MLARLKQDSRYPTLRLFCGREYNKTDWSEVPAGFEKQALNSDFIETRLQEDAAALLVASRVVEISPPVGSSPVFVSNVTELDAPSFDLEGEDKIYKSLLEPVETFNTASNDAPTETKTVAKRNRHGGK